MSAHRTICPWNEDGATARCSHPFLPLVRDRGEQHSLLPTLPRETDSCPFLKESAEIKMSQAISPSAPRRRVDPSTESPEALF